MQSYALLSDTACAKPASTDAIVQASTMPAAAAGAQQNTEALTQTAASSTVQAAVTQSSTSSRSKVEQNNFEKINIGCVNRTVFVPIDQRPQIRKKDIQKTTKKERTLDYIVRALHGKHEPPSIPMQAVPSDNDFYDDFEVIDNNSPMEITKNTQESSYFQKINPPDNTKDFEALNSESQYTQLDKDTIMTRIDPNMTSTNQKTGRETNLATNNLLKSHAGAKGQLLQNILLRSSQLSSYIQKEQDLAAIQKTNSKTIADSLESNQNNQPFNNTAPIPNSIYLHYDTNMDKMFINDPNTTGHEASKPHAATIPKNNFITTMEKMEITPWTGQEWKTGKEKQEVKKYRKYLSPVPSYSSLFAKKRIAQPATQAIPSGHSDAVTLPQSVPPAERAEQEAAVVDGAGKQTQMAPPAAKAAAAAAVLAAARTTGKETTVYPKLDCIDPSTRHNQPNIAVVKAATIFTATSANQGRDSMVGIVQGAPSCMEATASTSTAPALGWMTRPSASDNHLPAGMAFAARMTANTRPNTGDRGGASGQMAQPSVQKAPPTWVAPPAPGAPPTQVALPTGVVHEAVGMDHPPRPTTGATYRAYGRMARASAQESPPIRVAHESTKIDHSSNSLCSHPNTSKSTQYFPGSNPLKMLPWEAKDKHPLETQKALYIKDIQRSARPGRPPFTLDPDETMEKILGQMTTKIRQVEKDMYWDKTFKTTEEFCMMIDEYVNTIHELTDHQIRRQGIEIIPFYMTDNNAPPNLFLGSFTAQKKDYRQFWFCKPCDLIAFRKTNFRHHHMCETHSKNLIIWTNQMMASLNFGNTTPNNQEEPIKYHLDNHSQEGKTSIPNQPVERKISKEPPGLPKIDLPQINKDLQIMEKTMPVLRRMNYSPRLEPQNKEKTMPNLRRMDIQEPSGITTENNTAQSSKVNQQKDFTLTLMDYSPELKHQNKEKIMDEIRTTNPQNSSGITTTLSLKDTYLKDYGSTLRIINGTIPTKYKGDTIKLLSRFFNNRMGKNQKINFIREFLEDKNDQKENHWIVEKFQTLKKNNDLRLYLQHTWFTRLSITEKTLEQTEEIRPITDLARKLLNIFINCSIVPTNYLAILGIIANNDEYLPCPDSATSLSNSFYLDLFLNQGTIIIMEDQPDISNLMTKTHIGSDTHPVNKIQSGQSYSLQDTILHIPLMEDISENRKEKTQLSLPIDNSKEEIESNMPSTSFKNKQSTNHNMMYLSNIKKGTSRKDLSRLLDEYGNVKKIIKERIDDMEAVIYFHNNKDLHNTIAQVNGQEYKGRKLKAQITRKVTNPITIEEKSDRLSLKPSRSLLTSHIQKFRIVPGSRPTPIHWKKKALNPEETRKPIKMTLKRMEETHQNTYDHQRFFKESFQIKTIHDIRILPKMTVRFSAKLLRTSNPDMIIQDCQVSLICGPPPFFQIVDGTYDVRNSIISPSIRNNSGTNILIDKDTIIQGTTCHMDKYTQEQIQSMQGKTQQEKQAGYHIQAKMYHRINYLDNIAMKMNTQENHGLEPEDINPWDMDTN